MGHFHKSNHTNHILVTSDNSSIGTFRKEGTLIYDKNKNEEWLLISNATANESISSLKAAGLGIRIKQLGVGSSGGPGAVSSVFTRTGAVVAKASDYATFYAPIITPTPSPTPTPLSLSLTPTKAEFDAMVTRINFLQTALETAGILTI